MGWLTRIRGRHDCRHGRLYLCWCHTMIPSGFLACRLLCGTSLLPCHRRPGRDCRIRRLTCCSGWGLTPCRPLWGGPLCHHKNSACRLLRRQCRPVFCELCRGSCLDRSSRVRCSNRLILAHRRRRMKRKRRLRSSRDLKVVSTFLCLDLSLLFISLIFLPLLRGPPFRGWN